MSRLGTLLAIGLVAFSISVHGCDLGDSSPTDYGIKSREKSLLLKIGIVPEKDIFSQKDRFIRLLRIAEESVPVGLAPYLLSSRERVFQELQSGQLAGAFLDSFSAAMVLQDMAVDAQVRLEDAKGQSTHEAVVITRAGSGITDRINTWKARKIALIHHHSSAGFLFPISILAESGVFDYKNYFSRCGFLGSQERVLRAVASGRSDLGALSLPAYNRFRKSNPPLAEELIVLRKSPKFPSLTLVLRRDLPAGVVERFKAALLRLHENEEGHALLRKAGWRKFVPAKREDYQPIWEMMALLRRSTVSDIH